MPVRRWLALGVSAVILGLARPPGGAQGQQIRNPDTLTILQHDAAETLDPAQAYDTTSSFAFLWNVYETLIFFEGGRTDRFVPTLATEVPSLRNGGISPDGRMYTFKIRQGVRFHDGSPMTAEDVKYSLMRFMLIDPDGGPAWILLSSILGFGIHSTRDDQGRLIPDIWDRVDQAIRAKGNSVVIMLQAPYAPFLNIMASWSIIVSRVFVIGHGGWDGRKQTLAKYNNPKTPEELTLFNRASGTGPFRLATWDQATETIVLERNEIYWRNSARLKRIVIQTVEDFAPRLLALRNGDADIIDVPRANLPSVQGLSGARIVDDLARLSVAPAVFFNLNINPEANPDVGSGQLDGNGIPANFLADTHVRRGFAHLFDRERFIRETFRGKGRLANGPIPYGMLGYNPKGRWYEASTEQALAELKAAHNGRLWERGFRFGIVYGRGSTAAETAALMIKEAVQAVNPKFRIDVRGAGTPVWTGLFHSRKLAVYMSGWAADYADPDNFTVPFMHSTGTFASGQSYSNPEADRLIEQAARVSDPKKRQALYAQLQEIAFRDVPTIYVAYPVGLFVSRTWVKGWYHNPIFFGWGYLYLIYKA